MADQEQIYRQALGGKEMRFPHLGYTDSLNGRNGDQVVTCASLNVIGRMPYNPDWCGGTRPGVAKVFPVSFAQPNGIFTIPWRGDDGVSHESVVVVDGGVVKVVDGSSAAGTKAYGATDDFMTIITDDEKKIVFEDDSSASVSTGSAVGCVIDGKLFFRYGDGVKSYEPRTGIVADVLDNAYGATSMCVWRGRIVLYGADNVIHFSAVLDANDYDVGKHYETGTNATDIQLAEAGMLGGRVTAFMPFDDRTAFVATANELWKLSGDAIGGTLVRLSREVGVIQPTAWANGDGEIAFLSHDGMFFVNGEGTVSSLETTFENGVRRTVFAMRRPDLSKRWIVGYDRTILGYVVCAVSDGEYVDPCWIVGDGKSVWPTEFAAAQKPVGFARRSHVDGVSELLMVCKDGFVRSFDRSRNDDDAGAIASAVATCPVVHTTAGTEDAFVAEMTAYMDLNWTSANTNMSLFVGKNAHEVINKAQSFVDWVADGCVGDAPGEKARYSVGAGWNPVVRPRCRGNAVSVVFWNNGGRFSFSRVAVVSRGCGRIRG